MTTQDNINVVRRYLDQVINGGDLTILDQIWTKDMIWQGGSLGEIHGLADFTAFAAATTGAFADMHLNVQTIVADGDTVAVLFTNSGRHTGEFMGAAATGRSATWLGSGFYRIRDGKIAEATFAEDILSLLIQVGITAVPGNA